MRRLLFVALLMGGSVLVSTTGATGADKVTYTVGTTAEVDSLNVNVGYLVVDYEVWNNIWPTLTNLAADDFSVVPAMADQLVRAGIRPDVDVQDAPGHEVE